MSRRLGALRVRLAANPSRSFMVCLKPDVASAPRSYIQMVFG